MRLGVLVSKGTLVIFVTIHFLFAVDVEPNRIRIDRHKTLAQPVEEPFPLFVARHIQYLIENPLDFLFAV